MKLKHPIRDLILVILACGGIYVFIFIVMGNRDIAGGVLLSWMPQLAALMWAVSSRSNGKTINYGQNVLKVGCFVTIGFTAGLALFFLVSPLGLAIFLPTVIGYLVVQHINPTTHK
ncbi:hypothetical protein [Hymenobacter guriensis]|uniref:Uncharacterized protein n=1 Tax=Hymenobacter guriensis TaxID=2793065 RepID=A0ABS0L0E4_9BACT|nr:hypothetical protein [Hymenobacter guriensis]MBG8553580.1 hypothetical protein [Hymenobacter guriensis]